MHQGSPIAPLVHCGSPIALLVHRGSPIVPPVYCDSPFAPWNIIDHLLRHQYIVVVHLLHLGISLITFGAPSTSHLLHPLYIVIHLFPHTSWFAYCTPICYGSSIALPLHCRLPIVHPVHCGSFIATLVHCGSPVLLPVHHVHILNPQYIVVHLLHPHYIGVHL